MTRKTLTLLGRYLQSKRLDDQTLDRLRMENRRLMEAAAGENTMVRLENVFEIVDLALDDCSDPWQALKETTLETLYRRGLQIQKRKELKIRMLKEQWSRQRFHTPNIYYNAALAGTKQPAAGDYPVSRPMDEKGIRQAEAYAEAVSLENAFLNSFSPEWVDSLLRGFNGGYALLPINLLEPVLAAALGCSLLGREIRALRLTRMECAMLRERLMGMDSPQMQEALHSACRQIIHALQPGEGLKRYLEEAVERIAAAIRAGGTVFYPAVSQTDEPPA